MEMCAPTITAASSTGTGSDWKSKSKSSRLVILRRKNSCNSLFYRISIFTIVILFLVAFAFGDQLSQSQQQQQQQWQWQRSTTLGATATVLEQRLKRSVDYSLHPWFAGAAHSPQLPLPHDHLAAFGYRTKQKPQQFFQRDLTSLNLVNDNTNGNDRTREDICKEHCTCARQNAFIGITCDFEKNRKLSPVFGANFRIPLDATSIVINLAASTNFRLERGFFNNNKINSLTIKGTYNEKEQVEISAEAFQGNFGPFPEILLIGVFSVIVRSKAFSGNGKITVNRANDLIIYPDAFENAEISGLFTHINDLRINEKAFNSAKAKLRIESSHIDNIYRFEASLREIRFVNCTIGTINGGSFDVIKINYIVFEGCRIDVIKARAITEKLYSDHVSITGAIIGYIESEAIYGSGIAELILTKNNIETIQTDAIHVTAVNATISENNIKHLEKNWLRVKDWSNIIIEKNQFGVFGGMILEETKRPVTCRFDSNSLTEPLPGSLNITNRYCILRETSINMPCRCNLEWLEALSSHDLRSETYCTIDDKLKNCFNASTFNTLKYLNEVCDQSKTTLDCVANMNLKRVDGRFFTKEELAADNHLTSRLIYIAAGCAIVLLLLLVAVVFVIYRRRCCVNNDHSDSDSPKVLLSNDHLHIFSERDLHIIEENRQMMVEKHPNIEKRVTACVDVILQPNISHKKCVDTICKIQFILSKAKVESAYFTPFDQMLKQHLQPPLPSAPTPASTDPIYSEPTLREGADGSYTSSTIVGYMDQIAHCGPPNQQEHIYAEPSCAQQPLLRNEYASPADRNLDSNDDYTLPINERVGPRNLIIPYSVTAPPRPLQYAMPSPAHTQIRSPPYNLPDVLKQSHKSNDNNNLTNTPQLPDGRPLTNVQRITQNLQNQPKFQISLQNAPSSSRPEHLHLVAPPLYSAPSGSRRQRGPPDNHVANLASPERDEDFELELRGAAAVPTDCGSDHSGGSNETVQIDDIIEYADA